MEALGLISGILAVVQTGDRIVTLLDQIRPLFEAPGEVNNLISEITQLKTVFQDISTAFKDASSFCDIPSHEKRLTNMAKITGEGNEVLLKLQELISHTFLRPLGQNNDDSKVHGVSKVNRFAWARKREGVQRLRQRLRDISLTMLVQLGSLQVLWHSKLRESIDEVARSTALSISQNSDFQQSLLHRFDDVTRNLQNHPAIEDAQTLFGDQLLTGNDSSSAENRELMNNLSRIGLIKRRIEEHYRCRGPCPCTCHEKQTIQTSPFFSNLTGSLKKGPEFLLRVFRVVSSKSELVVSLRANDLKAVRGLLESRKATIYDIDERSGGTPLMLALQLGCDIEICKYLLTVGADTSRVGTCNMSPHDYIWTRILGGETKFEELYSYVPELEAYEGTGFTTLHRIVLRQHGGDLNRVTLEQDMINIDEKDRWGYTALALSCQRGENQFTDKLLELGANPDIGGYDVDFNLPLRRAAAAGHISCFFTLLDHGADICLANSISKMNRSLLILMAQGIREADKVFCEPISQSIIAASNNPVFRNESWIEKVLQAGFDINACDTQGINALSWAVRANKVHVTDLLLRSGANYLQNNPLNYTILHAAAHYGSIDMLSVLKRHKLAGLRLDAELADGRTPLDLAMARKDVSDQWIAAWEEMVRSIIAADLELERKSHDDEIGSGTLGIGELEDLVIREEQEHGQGMDAELVFHDAELVFHDAEEFIASS